MKPLRTYVLLSVATGAVLCMGCSTPQKQLPPPSPRARSLPQLVRFYKVLQVKRSPGSLYISGSGGASADGGKYPFTAKSALSSYPFIRMTIQSDSANPLASCQQQVQDAKENHRSIDIRGMGVFTIESTVDPPLDTGVFTLTQLNACGAAVFSSAVSTPAVSSAVGAAVPAAVSAADLVAVPERFLDHATVITGRLEAPVHFSDPVSHLVIESTHQFLNGYFLTQTLAAESRLSLVHAEPGSVLVLEGTLTRVTPHSLAAQSGESVGTGYEFDMSRMVSIEPAPAQSTPPGTATAQ